MYIDKSIRYIPKNIRYIDESVIYAVKLVTGFGGVTTPGWQSPVVVYYNDGSLYQNSGFNAPNCKSPAAADYSASFPDYSYPSPPSVTFNSSSTGNTVTQTFVVDVLATRAAGDININGATISTV